jgi:hypothetical protein
MEGRREDETVTARCDVQARFHRALSHLPTQDHAGSARLSSPAVVQSSPEVVVWHLFNVSDS